MDIFSVTPMCYFPFIIPRLQFKKRKAHSMFCKLRIASAVLCCAILCFGTRAESQVQQSDLVASLQGKTVSSLTVIGGSGAPLGYRGNFPVNTLAYPDGQIEYRVEIGFIRGGVGPMLRSYRPGTVFEISSVELTGNRLELKLVSRDQESERLKLMLGSHWQSTMTNSGVLQAIGRFVRLPDLPSPSYSAQTSQVSGAQTLPVPMTAAVAERGPEFTYQRPATAPAIPGRPQGALISNILMHLQQEIDQAQQQAAQASANTAAALHAFQEAYSGMRDFGAQREIAEIVNLENRLGNQLAPSTQSDAESLDLIFQRCRRLAIMRQTEDGTGQEVGSGGNDPEYVNSFLRNNGLHGQDAHAQDMAELRISIQRIEVLRGAGSSIVNTERILDADDLISVPESFSKVETASSVSAAAAEYLTAYSSLRADIASYANARNIGADPDSSPLGIILLIRKEVSLLPQSSTGPLTEAYLTAQISARKASLRTSLEEAPPFSSGPSKNAALNTIERFTTIRAAISASSLSPVVDDPQALPDIRRWLGEEVYEEVVRKGKGITKAESDATLLQGKIEAAKAAEQEAKQQRERVAEERAQAASEIVNTALLITKLDEQFEQTQIMGYTMEAAKQREKFAYLVRANRSNAVWTEVQSRFQQILPGLTVWEAKRMESLIESAQP